MAVCSELGVLTLLPFPSLSLLVSCLVLSPSPLSPGVGVVWAGVFGCQRWCPLFTPLPRESPMSVDMVAQGLT